MSSKAVGTECQPTKGPEPLSKSEREALVLEYRIKARKLARSFLRRWGVYLELHLVDSVVDLSLCEAVGRFDPRRGASFMTFMYYYLRGNLMRLISDNVSKTELSSGVCVNRSPDDCFFVVADDVVEALHPVGPKAPDEIVATKEVLDLCREACEKLDDLGQAVIERYYFGGEPITKIASSLGYSRSHISRVKSRALKILGEEVGALSQVMGDVAAAQETRERYERESAERVVIRRRKSRDCSTAEVVLEE